MPALTKQDLKVVGQQDLTFTTLDGANDEFTFTGQAHEYLIVRNPTGGTINATLIGAQAPATVECDGIGTVSVTAEPLDLLTTEDKTLYLNEISTKLQGLTTITGGTGLEVAWVET